MRALESSAWRNSAHAFYRKLGYRQDTAAERFRRPVSQPPGHDLEAFLTLAGLAATRVAGALGGHVGVETPDKRADLEAEAAAVQVLGALAIPILSEESGWFGAPAAPGSRERWISLDPLDGSRNLRAGLPPWAFSAALVEDGVALAGLVSDLASDHRWWATHGDGAWTNGRRTFGTCERGEPPRPDRRPTALG